MNEEGAVQAKLKEHDGLFKQNREEHKDMRDAITSIRNRPPAWVGFIITALACLATGLLVKMAG